MACFFEGDMKSKIKYLAFGVSAFFTINSYASTIDQIKILEERKNGNYVQEETIKNEIKKENIINLSTGKSIDISEWQIVHFIKSDCPYCHQFDPTLKQIADSINLPVFVFSFDGMGDNSFPLVYPVNDEIIRTFFAEIPQATPTSFLVNVNTLVTVPLSQGAVSANSLLQRLDESFILIDKLKNEEGVIK